MNKLALIISGSILSLSSHAGLNSDMNDFFESSGMQSNVTGPGAYQGQTAGMYTGGQLYARNQVKNVHPASISLPSLSAGCGGIDAFTGSFSFLSGDELISSMKAIASNATSYAFMLGMETVSPQLSGVQKHLSNLANTVNRANINSCEAASSLVGGLWPKTEVAQNHICTSAGSSSGALSDWAQAKQGCASGKMTSTLSGKEAKEYKDMIVVNRNIAWEAIKKNSFLQVSDNNKKLDREMKEIMMTISGTVIVKNKGKDDSPNEIAYLHSLANDRAFIKAMLYGGEMEIYRCDEIELCLNPTRSKTKISLDASFVDMVLKTLISIKDKIVKDEALTPEQINFLNTTTLPLYKMFNVEYAMGKDTSILNINSYADLIAADLLHQYLTENLEIMRHASRSLDLMEEYMGPYRSTIEKARSMLNHERGEMNITINQTLNIVRQTQLLEQTLAGRMSSHLVNVEGWGNGG